MAYTSDLRIKNLIKEVHLNILKELESKRIEEKIFLRIFDESKEDSNEWEKGGLTFKDSRLNLELGSNDAAWYYEKEGIQVPLVVIEGTFGTERGQFGDGQLNRFSHALGPAINGYIGVLLTPFKGESYVKVDGSKGGFKYKFQYAHLRKDIVKAALKINQTEKGKYFTIDAYEPNVLKELVIHSFLKAINLKNNLEEISNHIEDKMRLYVMGKQRGTSNQLLSRVYDQKGDLLENYTGRIFTHNIAALTTSQKRDGHGLLGKNLVETYLIDTEFLACIFIRLHKEDIELLRKRTAKEFTYLLNNPKLKVIGFNDLSFKDQKVKKQLSEIKEDNLLLNSKKSFIKQLKSLFEKGEIQIKL